MNIDRRWKERGETLGPALLAVVALGLDVAVEGESSVHAVAVGVIALGVATSLAGAVVSLGRYGTTRLARRFAIWRALGLAAAAFCLGLALVERLSAPRLVADATLYLSVLGGAWAFLTGWVWGRRSWERLARGLLESQPEAEARAQQSVRWAGREIGEA
jgi:hypothetical protein